MVRGQKRTIKTPTNIDVQASIHNRFDIEVVDANTGQIKQTAQAENVICNNLWTQLFKPATYFNYVFYGGGSGTPSSSDTSLFSHIGYMEITNDSYTVDFETGICCRKGSVQLAAATAAGKTISEVGIGYGTSSSNLCTHAMLKDMNGNPISIQKTATDVINIYATIYVHFERLGYDNNTIFLQKTSRYSYYVAQMDDLFTWFSGDYYQLPKAARWSKGDTLSYLKTSSSSLEYPSQGSTVAVTYSADVTNRRMTLTLARLEASAGNYDQGLNHVCLGGTTESPSQYWNPVALIYSGGASFPYSTIEDEAVATGDGVTKDFALDFAFPHDAKVYVDGVETTDFTLEYAPNTVNWLYWMKGIHPASTPEEIIPQTQKSDSLYQTHTMLFYNPLWEYGIASLGIRYGSKGTCAIETSNDNVSWELLNITPSYDSSTSIYTYNIPEEYLHNKFWKIIGKNTSSNSAGQLSQVSPPSIFTGKCLHLGTPPAEGAVITADYRCDCFAKDANHVLDMTLTFQFNEYTEAQ